MPGPLGKLTAVLGIDAREFQTGIQSAQNDLSGFGVNSKTAFTAVGAAATAGFGLMTAGALQAESAQGKFMAATGASRDAAKQFVSGMDGLAGSAGAVGKSFEEISQVGTTVEQQFGTTGQATADLTENILEFSKVTGTSANDAANTLDDTLAAFNLTTDAAAPLMDQLVVAQQKFGVSVADGLPALQAMAPALDAMGASADDGVALLGAFEQGGIEAADAASALNKAVKTLKPGQNLNDLVKEISGIEDPTLRAQKAIQVFGKAGAKMAQVFQPGIDSLDQFQISADEASGASAKAANDMLTTSDKIRGAFDKLSAGARELGQQFGPAITGLGTVASGLATVFSKLDLGGAFGTLTSKLKDGFVKLAGAVLPTATAEGAVIGGAMAEGEAEGAGGTSAIAKIGARIGAMSIPLTAEGTTVGTAVGSAMTLGVLAGWFAVGVGVLELPAILDHLTGQDATSKFANIGKFWADSTLTGLSDEFKGGAALAFQTAWEAARARGAGVDEAAAAGRDAAAAYLQGLVPTLADEMNSHKAWAPISQAMQTAGAVAGPEFVGAAETSMANAARDAHLDAVAEHFAGNVSGSFKSAIIAKSGAFKAGLEGALSKVDFGSFTHKLGDDGASQFALGWEQGVPDIHQQWKDFVHDMKNGLDPAKEMAWLQGKLSSKRLTEGLASNDPTVRAKAQHEYDILQGEWQGLYDLGYRSGKKGGEGVPDGLDSKKGAAVHSADAIKTGVQNKLDSIDLDLGKVSVQAPTNVDNIVRYINGVLSGIHTNIKINVGTGRNPFPEGAGHGGRRALGGPVGANSMYEVAEGGMPEMLSSGGKSFLLMGAVGGYVSRINRALSGVRMPTVAASSGGGGDVHVHFHGPIYGGRAGLRDLARDIEDAVRQGTRGGGWQVGRS